MPEETDRWIADLPDSRLDDIRQSALELFSDAARTYMAAELEAARQGASDSALIREVQLSNAAVAERVLKSTAFWRNFAANLFIGVIASFVFSLLLIGASLIVTRDPSPFALYRSLAPAAPPEH